MSDFRYDRLMEIKERLLEQKQRELEIAITSLAAVMDDIRKAEKETADTYDQIATRCLTGRELSVLTGYLSYLDMTKERLHNEKRDGEKRVTNIRNALISLEIELKVLEKLKFKMLQAAKKVLNRKEQKLMDDLALRAEGK